MKSVILAVGISALLCVVLGKIAVPWLKRLRAGQVVLGYVKEHENKSGTPTMGGLFFFVSAMIAYLIVGDWGKTATLCLVVGGAYLIVGFLDDFIKIFFHRNLGLRAYQKAIFQTAIAMLAAFFAYRNELTRCYLPFVDGSVDLKGWCIPFYTFIFLATTNCVNLTDGLDGLAAGTTMVYLTFIGIFVLFSTELCQTYYIANVEKTAIAVLCACFVGTLLGFLVYNVPRASVFMGDTGSLCLGGIVASVTIFSGFSLFLPILGIMYVLSGISVIVQVLHFKRTGKRIFLMAPLHHHFQKKGYSESKISFCYAFIGALIGCFLLYAVL